MKEMYCIVRGRAQLVMYRDFVSRAARKLGLVGYAKNLPDGTVEVVAQGPQEKLEALLVHMRKGSFLSRVDAVDATWREAAEEHSDFLIAW
jgi:acylphosphatase